MYKPSHTWFPLHVLVNSIKKEPSTKVYGVFDRFHELTGFTSYHKTVVHDRVHGLIPKNIYQVPHLLPSNLPNNF